MVEAKKPRRLKAPKYKRFRYTKRIKHPQKVSTGWQIFKQSLTPLRRQWKVFGALVIIYALLNVVLVHGLANTSSLPELKTLFDATAQGTGSQISSTLALFGVLVGTNGAAGEAAGVYQSILQVIMSLAFVWVIRSVGPDAKKKVRIRDAFYQGMYPLVPFLLVMLVIVLQLIPMLIGATLYSIVIGNGLAVTAIEQLAWVAAFFILTVFSLYMVSTSLIALFVVTLPNMTPVKALKTAGRMTRYRRWTVIRKELLLPIIILVLLGVLLVPFILWLTPAAEWVYILLSAAVLPLVVSYLYTLYKELI